MTQLTPLTQMTQMSGEDGYSGRNMTVRDDGGAGLQSQGTDDAPEGYEDLARIDQGGVCCPALACPTARGLDLTRKSERER